MTDFDNNHVRPIASLPWYDHAESRAVLDTFWSATAAALREAGYRGLPRALTRDLAPAVLWQRPSLVLSQCCGPDLQTDCGQDLRVIATPVFQDIDCTPGQYFSHVISRKRFSGPVARIAINATSSHSGCRALLDWMRARDITVAKTQVTGSHVNSILASDHSNYAPETTRTPLAP